MRAVRSDCRHYVGDRPCLPHKQLGAVCDGCADFTPVGQRVLLVKLDAMGDVLRTTCILEPLHRALGHARVTWVTRPESLPLLAGNALLDRAVPYGPEALAVALGDEFDHVLCLDAAHDAVRLAAIAVRASRQAGRDVRASGFLLRDGAVACADDRARTWWQMGLWDDLKRANTRTYQSLLMEMLGLDGPSGGYVLRLNDDELADGRRALEAAGLERGEPFLALNAGGGGRWVRKRWTEPHMVRFIGLVRERLGLRTALFGGDAERDLLGQLLAHAPAGTFFPGVHPVRRFAAMLAAAEAVVTGDTLAMHLALAAARPTVILFGPTSAAEIETFGTAEKVWPEMDCLCCYLPICDRAPHCQELLGPERVFAALQTVLARRRCPPAGTGVPAGRQP